MESGKAGQTSPFGLPGELKEGEFASMAFKELHLVFCLLLLGRTGKEAEGRESFSDRYRQSCSRAQSSEEGPRSEGESGN